VAAQLLLGQVIIEAKYAGNKDNLPFQITVHDREKNL
jgi:hypothetical protein